MRSRAAVAQYEATVVLVVVSLSLASVVYAGLRRGSSLQPQSVFVNVETLMAGSPSIERLVVNASSLASVSSLSLDSAGSVRGILHFDGNSYSTTASLCAAGETTFFSVLASQAGQLQVATDGEAWVSGTWGAAASVPAGWQEVMIVDGTHCTVTLPGGQAVASQWSLSSQALSSVPVLGSLAGTTFELYFPVGGGPHTVLLTTSGGFDQVAA